MLSLKDEWEFFTDNLAGMTDSQISLVRLIFYSGASRVLTTMAEMIENETLLIDADAVELENHSKEIVDFFREL
jgi:hypothetical protein